mmetsp:Transcript_35632/g.66044  ORF Transcript_35632/g.66044 Transcript_35632/m.66044 type:complete len:726 (+) Transcript_35632:69-2246(+)
MKVAVAPLQRSAAGPIRVLSALCMLACTRAAGAADVSPVRKVLNLLSKMQTTLIDEAKANQKVYGEFEKMCEEHSIGLQKEIKSGKGQVANLEAAIEQYTDKANSKAVEIEELSSKLTTNEADLKAADKIRKHENADFITEEQDLLSSIGMIERAITILEKAQKGNGASLAQLPNVAHMMQALSTMVEASGLRSEGLPRLTALIQTSDGNEDGDEELDFDAANVEAYASGDNSKGVLDTLEGLLDKAQAMLEAARNKETSSRHNYELFKQSLEDKIAVGEKDMDAAKKAQAEAGEVKATSEGDLTTIKEGLAEDIKSLEDLHHTCMSKATDFQETVTDHGLALKAIAKAKEVVEQSTGTAELIAYTANSEQVSFMQVRRMRGTEEGALLSDDTPSLKALRIVRKLSKQEHSAAFSQLASRMASALRASSISGKDPFATVRNLISGMLEKLRKEQDAEASQKKFCDKEMSSTQQDKDDKEDELDKLTTKIDKLTSWSVKVKEEVAVLQEGIAENAQAMAELDKIRAEEKADYEKARPELEQGVEGVKTALKVLREYYAKGSDEPTTPGTKSSGMSSIIGLLEEVESDFSKNLSELIAEEESAQAAYEETKEEHLRAKQLKEKDITQKSSELSTFEKQIVETSTDRNGLQEELDAVNKYFNKVKEQCTTKVEPYEERQKRRQALIAGLQEALQALGGGGASFLQLQMRLSGTSVRHLRRLRGHSNIE